MPKKQKVTILPKETETTELPSRDYQIIDFDVIQEEWNKYRLEDGVILKSKFVLINVMMEKSLEVIVNEAKEKKESEAGMGISIQSRNVLGVEAPKKLRGPPSGKYNPKELRASIIKKDIDFEVIKGTQNKYSLKNGMTIRVRQSPLEVAKTNKFDSQGLPIYLVNSTVDVKITLPEEIEKELKQLKTVPS